MCKKYLIFIVLLFGSVVIAEDDVHVEGERGFAFVMAETGSGLGGFYNWPVMNIINLGVAVDAYFLRDENQITFQDPYSGLIYDLNKENNVYLFDFMVTIKRRFFAEDMDDSFRPFLSAGIGPFYGINYPEYDRDLQGNPQRDQFAWTLGGFFGAGADITAGEAIFVGIRAQYRIIPFAEEIGEGKNHSMFELRFEIGQRF